MGGTIFHFIVGIKIMWGGISPYITSYLIQFDESVTYHQTLHVYTAIFLGQSLFMYLGGQLEKKLGPRMTAYIGATLISGCTYLSSYCTTLHWLIFLQALVGMGIGLSYSAPILCGFSHFKHNKGIVTGVITTGTGAGPFLFGLVATTFVNSENYPVDQGTGLYPATSPVVERVPDMFKLLGIMYAVIGFGGATLLMSPTDEEDKALDSLMMLENGGEKASLNGSGANVYDKAMLHSEQNNILTPKATGRGHQRYGSKVKFTTTYELKTQEMIRDSLCWVVIATAVCTGVTGFYVAATYKNFGQKSIADDHFLTVVGCFGCLCSGLSRILWGTAADNIGHFETLELTGINCCNVIEQNRSFALILNMMRLYIIVLVISSIVLLTDGFSASVASSSPSSLNKVDNNKWKWRGHDIYTEAYNQPDGKQKPTCILLHGFGASTVYYRETIQVLQQEGYNVHALDLLGQGRSAKPFVDNNEYSTVDTNNKVEYSINLWGNMIDDYAKHKQLDDVVLMGNSIGSLVCLSAATGDFADSKSDTYLADKVKGLCFFNCGVGLNSRNVIKNPNFNGVQRVLFNSLFDLLNTLIFDNAVLLRYVLNNVVTKELLKDALISLYTNSPERVDDELVDSFYYPAKEGEGCVESVRQIYCNDAGLTPLEYHQKHPEILDHIPLHLVWGKHDVVTPLQGDVGTFYCDRVANNRSGNGKTSIDVINSGHIPFDDNPIDTHKSMLKWLNSKVVK